MKRKTTLVWNDLWWIHPASYKGKNQQKAEMEATHMELYARND
jgi:hypothetical protein